MLVFICLFCRLGRHLVVLKRGQNLFPLLFFFSFSFTPFSPSYDLFSSFFILFFAPQYTKKKKQKGGGLELLSTQGGLIIRSNIIYTLPN